MNTKTISDTHRLPLSKRWNPTQQIILAAVHLALGLFLPFLTGQLPTLGKMISPMHFPVLLAAFLLGPIWGLILGALTPILRSLIFTMPPMVPMAVCMAFEMGAYGLVTGLINQALFERDSKQIARIYGSMVPGMIVGRLVYALVFWLFFDKVWTFEGFLGATVLGSWPGIVLQLIIIPIIVVAVERSGIRENK